MSKIIYTKTDEAPALATQSLLPIIRTFLKSCGVEIELKDISLASRIIARFSDYLIPNHRINDDLADLGNLVTIPEANIIKLPNISASIPQLKAAISELQKQGISIPNYPEEPSNDEEFEIKSRYDKIKGSAVNPILREGNSDRRAPKAVKEYARKNPHSMGEWSKESKTHVATMSSGDFRSNEKSITLNEATSVQIALVSNGSKTILKNKLDLLKGEIIDATVLSKKDLLEFLEREVRDAKDKGVLFSIHLKATMMKVSDPIIFGHAVRVFFKEVFNKHDVSLDKLGIDVNNGFGDLLSKISSLPTEERLEIEADINDCLKNNADIAMVNSDKGITNLHVPSDVIVDASMPAMIRSSGKMWNPKGELQDTKCVIPDSSYAKIYQVAIDFCRENGAFDPKTMGSSPNVGLMAQKAEEYGSHDKTFEISQDGVVQVIDESGSIILEHRVSKGDIWRMCQVKDAPIKDWVKLAVNRARASKVTTVFWLDENRAHDIELIKKVNHYLKEHDTRELDIRIKSLSDAALLTMQRMKDGLDTISVTGNVLRDYLTDLFPILELGTSAKMLSIVPLMNGGGLFETGAGGSAPKHVEQFFKENHLRWDSLGEFLALAASLEHFAASNDNPKANILADTLNDATTRFLLNDKSPSRKVKELDNRGSHFYLALYWAEAIRNQDIDKELKQIFSLLYDTLLSNELKIVNELNDVQGTPVNLDAYYYPDDTKVEEAMRPSQTFNRILAEF